MTDIQNKGKVVFKKNVDKIFMFNISCHWFVFPLSFDVKTEVLLLPVSCQISIFSFYYYYYFFLDAQR